MDNESSFVQEAQASVEALERPVIIEEVEAVAKPVLYKFTNQAESHELDNILAMFYMGTYENTLGIMQAFNLETGEQELILVGVMLDEDGKPDCYPLASVLNAEKARNYLAPDGRGKWYDPRNMTEASEAKENMRSFNEAVVEPVSN